MKGSLGLSIHLPNSIAKEKIRSDVGLRHFFTHSTSFIILVDTEVLTIEREMMDNINLFSMYEYHTKPTMPMIDYLGRLPVYQEIIIR